MLFACSTAAEVCERATPGSPARLTGYVLCISLLASLASSPFAPIAAMRTQIVLTYVHGTVHGGQALPAVRIICR